MNALSETLRVVRLVGAIFSNHHHTAAEVLGDVVSGCAESMRDIFIREAASTPPAPPRL